MIARRFLLANSLFHDTVLSLSPCISRKRISPGSVVAYRHQHRHPETTTVPIGSEPELAVGDVVIWNHSQATQLFDAMRHDTPVPKSLLTGSKLTPAA